MVAGCLAKAGYDMGEDLLPANPSNPKGFFESTEVNTLNEDILESVAPVRPSFLGGYFHRHIPLKHQRWLLALPQDVKPKGDRRINARIANLVARAPFCFKDPRFCYTLPVWRAFLKETVCIVVYREPTATAKSIVKECKDSEPLHTLSMRRSRALKVWQSMYSRVLEMSEGQSDWLFVHFRQVLEPAGLDTISDVTGAMVDRSFPDIRLRRSVPSGSNPPAVEHIYDQLNIRSGFTGC
jgi:hypothetical protein